jgi:hypothetical protein
MKRLLLACFAWFAAGAAADEPPLPLSTASGADLRGTYRAALCGRPDMPAPECARTLRKFGGEAPAPRPPAADPSRLRLLFVPGFLASCFAVNSFGDVVESARKLGFAADVLAVGGRDTIGVNARLLAEQIDRLPSDGRRLVLIGHSKGVPDLLEMLATRPDIATRVLGLLSVAGASQGSPLANELHGLYGITLGIVPFSNCARSEGDAVVDLSPEARRQWWARFGPQLRTSLYALVALPDLDRLSPVLVLPYAGLSRISRDNDGLLLVYDQVMPNAKLLGVVNADHLSVAIPYPGNGWVFVFSAVPFPRPQVILAAVDVMAARE